MYIDSNEHQNQIMNIETQKMKTPMRGDRYGRKITVSYMLIVATGNPHKPIFTYMCQVNDKTGNLVLT